MEYYYTEFKRASDFTTIKERLRERERFEYEQAMTEGAVTVRFGCFSSLENWLTLLFTPSHPQSCDHCKTPNTPRWRAGPDKQDLCDRCYYYHKRLACCSCCLCDEAHFHPLHPLPRCRHSQLPRLDDTSGLLDSVRYQDWLNEAPSMLGFAVDRLGSPLA